MNPIIAALKTALLKLDIAVDHSVDVMNEAVDAEMANTFDADKALQARLDAADADVQAYEAEAITLAGKAALQMAEENNYSAVEIKMLSDMFAPALEGRFSDYMPETRVQLLNRAYNLAECFA